MPGLETFLSGYRGREAQLQAEPMRQLQQLGGLQSLMANQQKAQKEQAFRTRLAAAKTPEERVAVAEEFSDAAGILSHADRLEATKGRIETGKARLAAAATQHDQNLAHKKAQLAQVVVTDANRDQLARANLELETWDKNVRAAISGELMRMTGERGAYDYGGTAPKMPNFGPAPTPPSAPPSAASAPAAGGLPPNIDPTKAPPQDLQAILSAMAGVPAAADRQVSPQEEARMRLLPAGGGGKVK